MGDAALSETGVAHAADNGFGGTQAVQDNGAAVRLGEGKLVLEGSGLAGARFGRLGFVVEIQPDFADQQRGVAMQAGIQFGKCGGCRLLRIPRMDADGGGTDFRLSLQFQKPCPVGVFGGGGDKAGYAVLPRLRKDFGQPEKQGGMGKVDVGVGEHGLGELSACGRQPENAETVSGCLI